MLNSGIKKRDDDRMYRITTNYNLLHADTKVAMPKKHKQMLTQNLTANHTTTYPHHITQSSSSLAFPFRKVGYRRPWMLACMFPPILYGTVAQSPPVVAWQAKREGRTVEMTFPNLIHENLRTWRARENL